ncbi:MAG: hypothetical protein L6Q99_03170 [Planctomycetes bacterium]|nr:hypothetical protein [Planctomycetota bacterium]
MPSSPSRANGPRILFLVVAIVASIAAVVWFVMRAPRATDVAAAGAATPDVGPRAATTADADPNASAAAAERERVAGGAEAAVDTQDGANAELDSGPRLRLRAIRAGSLDVLPDVEFVWLQTAPDDQRFNALWTAYTNGELDLVLERGGKRVAADEFGCAEIPLPARQTAIVARSPGWWGVAWWQTGGSAEIEVTLERDRNISVVVVDAANEPVVGIPVGLRATFWGNQNDRMRARTDGEGKATLAHVDPVFRQGGAQEWSVALAIPLAAAVSVPVDDTNLPTEPVRLVLPATGVLDVRILDPHGAPAEGTFDVTLTPAPPAPNDAPGNPRRWLEGASVNDVSDGVAEFPWVGVGLEVVATARRVGTWTAHTARGFGPRRAGERVELVLRLESAASTLTGRAVDRAGAPLASASFDLFWSFGEDGQVGPFAHATTDANGAFRVSVESPESEHPTADLTIRVNDSDFGAAAEGSRSVGLPLAQGELDLGDVFVDALPLVVSGVVVDELGQPVKTAGVRAFARSSDSEHAEFSGDWWGAGRTNGEGRFELRGRANGDEIDVTATSAELASPPVRARRGQRDVVVALEATGTLAGRVVADATTRSGAMIVQLMRETDGEGEFVGHAEVAADGGFVVRRLWPGSYTAMLHDASLWSELTRVPGIVVRAGEVTRDPRLDPLDLRGTRFVVKLTVVDERGDPVPQGWFWRELSDANGEEQNEWGPISNGKLTAAHDGTGATLHLQAEGYCSLKLEKVVTDQTVTMHRAPNVRLVVRPVPELAPDVELYALVDSVIEGDGQAWLQIGPDGEGEDRVGILGKANVSFMVKVGPPNEDGVFLSIDDVQREIEVLPASGAQRFELELAPEKLAAAIANARASAADGSGD